MNLNDMLFANFYNDFKFINQQKRIIICKISQTCKKIDHLCKIPIKVIVGD